MKIKLLIATGDCDYADHLSDMLSEKQADTIEVSVSRTYERLCDMLATARFDVALLEPSWTTGADPGKIRLPLLLWTDTEDVVRFPAGCKQIKKYQRVSAILECIFENYAKINAAGCNGDTNNASFTAVWSPAGGVGKTTVALAYAAKKAAEGKHVMYLNLEYFSSVPVYFPETGRSISLVFEMLENSEGNAGTLISGIKKQDAGTGIYYLYLPENYDDMNILTAGNITSLLCACAGAADEVVVDMPCTCDERTRGVFDMCEKVFLVTDAKDTAHAKLLQFTLQHNVFARIKPKSVLIANKAALPDGLPLNTTIRLPVIQSADASAVYKALSLYSFGAQ